MKHYVVNEQYENDCGSIESVNHVFLDFEKAKAQFEVLVDPDISENVVLQVGAEDPDTGEIVGVANLSFTGTLTKPTRKRSPMSTATQMPDTSP